MEVETAQVVRVKRELLAPCMTCLLCHQLLDEATTISECLHTFCRKCIFEKLTDEEENCCPICHTDLGCLPVEKLRADHNLQDVRAKIFPVKRRKVIALEELSVPLPIKIKERSLSSLGVNTTRMGRQSGLTRRRTKALGRRASGLRGLAHSSGESNKKEEAISEDHAQKTNPPDTLNMITQNRRQNSSNAEASNKDIENEKQYGDGTGLWNPLNCLVEAANRKALATKTEQINGADSNANISKSKTSKHPKESRVDDDGNGSVQKPQVLVKSSRMRGINRKKKEHVTSAQAMLDAVGGKHEKNLSYIWISLLASADQDGNTQLPQLSANYLRIKDGNLPASYIQKYLVKKLDLGSETEVDIACQGVPVDPTMPLHGLVDMWPQKRSSDKLDSSVGSSAKDFIMVLTYRRKAPSP